MIFSTKNLQKISFFGLFWVEKWQRQKFLDEVFLIGIDSEWSKTYFEVKISISKKNNIMTFLWGQPFFEKWGKQIEKKAIRKNSYRIFFLIGNESEWCKTYFKMKISISGIFSIISFLQGLFLLGNYFLAFSLFSQQHNFIIYARFHNPRQILMDSCQSEMERLMLFYCQPFLCKYHFLSSLLNSSLITMLHQGQVNLPLFLSRGGNEEWRRHLNDASGMAKLALSQFLPSQYFHNLSSKFGENY